ncbi:MAG: glycosyltransferase family 4 protein [Planctomycetaceae bacterium]|nr:glycosyltransferase family 4 protein [Planctomycetaceae bacterium]
MSDSKIRICHVIGDLRPSGAARSVCEMSRRLNRDRFDVRVLALRGGSAAQWFQDAAIDVTDLEMTHPWRLLRLRGLSDQLRRLHPDIVHTHLYQADLAARPAARLAAVPHLIHTARTPAGRFRPWEFAFTRFLAGYCDRLVCVSESVRQFHQRRSGLPEEKYALIPDGIDIERFAPAPRLREAMRRQWGVDERQIVVGFVGRLNAQKGIDTLLSAISHLGARGNPVNVVIAGQGPRQAIVRNFIRYGEGGRSCRLLDFVDDVPALLNALDIMVLPSRWEAFGTAAAEAMAVGLPVIVSDTGHLRDLVAHRRTGILIDPGDSVALSETILELAADAPLRQTLGAAAREHVRATYPIEKTVAAHEALYEQVAGG